MDADNDPEDLNRDDLAALAAKADRRRRAKRLLFTCLIFLGLAVVAAGLVAGFMLISSGEGESKVPEVIGMRFDDAREKLESAGFEVEIDPAQSPDESSAERLRVEQQDPKAGSAFEQGGFVTLSLDGLPDVETLVSSASSVSPAPTDMQGSAVSPESSAQSQAAGATQSARATGAAQRLVCIDPGHSTGGPASEIDPETGLDVADNSGAEGEIAAMWELAQKVKSRLEQSGCAVRLTKDRPDSCVSLKRRAEIGNTCELMVRLHYDPAFQAVLYPGEGQYKEHSSSRVYVDATVAHGSEALADSLIPFLSDVGISKKRNDIGGTSNNTGDAFVVSVLSRVPVVLIENDPDTVRDNPAGQDRVADAIAQGIMSYFSSH